jgi:hypothetical protein
VTEAGADTDGEAAGDEAAGEDDAAADGEAEEEAGDGEAAGADDEGAAGGAEPAPVPGRPANSFHPPSSDAGASTASATPFAPADASAESPALLNGTVIHPPEPAQAAGGAVPAHDPSSAPVAGAADPEYEAADPAATAPVTACTLTVDCVEHCDAATSNRFSDAAVTWKPAGTPAVTAAGRPSTATDRADPLKPTGKGPAPVPEPAADVPFGPAPAPPAVPAGPHAPADVLAFTGDAYTRSVYVPSAFWYRSVVALVPDCTSVDVAALKSDPAPPASGPVVTSFSDGVCTAYAGATPGTLNGALPCARATARVTDAGTCPGCAGAVPAC